MSFPTVPAVVPALSTHEVAKGTETITEQAAFVKFPLSANAKPFFWLGRQRRDFAFKCGSCRSPNILYVR